MLYFSRLFKREVYLAGAHSAQRHGTALKSTPCGIQTLFVSPEQSQGRVILSTAMSYWQEERVACPKLKQEIKGLHKPGQSSFGNVYPV